MPEHHNDDEIGPPGHAGGTYGKGDKSEAARRSLVHDEGEPGVGQRPLTPKGPPPTDGA